MPRKLNLCCLKDLIMHGIKEAMVHVGLMIYSKKIDLYPRASLFSLLAKKLQLFNRKKVGVEIKICEPFFVENREDLCTDMDNNGISSRVFKISRSRPILVSSPSGSSHICGVAVGHGSICTKPAVEGRKRCPEHKGMKVNGSISKFNMDRKGSSDGFQNPGLTHTGVINRPSDFELHISDRFAPICGVILDSGSPCKKQPALRNKRCLEQKGRRVSRPKFVGQEMEQKRLGSGSCVNKIDKPYVEYIPKMERFV